MLQQQGPQQEQHDGVDFTAAWVNTAQESRQSTTAHANVLLVCAHSANSRLLIIHLWDGSNEGGDSS
jgi:hypothetical protein